MIWCIILTIICLLPIYILIINATRLDTDIAGGLAIIPDKYLARNMRHMKSDFGNLFKPLVGYKNSAIITCSATFLTVFFSALTAYGIQVYDFKLKEPSYMVILFIMMVPTQVTATGFLNFMAKIHLTDTYWPLILPAIAAPAIVFFMRSYMKSSFPLEIVEAARIDGSGEFRTFLTIAIPMMKPAIAVQAIFAFVANWNNFYTPSMILLSSKTDQKTLPMMISAIQASDKTGDLGVVYTCIALSIVPIIIAYVALSKFIIAGVALGGVKE
jgi:multiple sugar transport system permease protein